MNFRPLDRRALLRGGAAVGSLAFAGLGEELASASPRAGSVPLTGTLAGWLAIAPDGSGQLTLLQIDAQSRPGRQVAVETGSAEPLSGYRPRQPWLIGNRLQEDLTQNAVVQRPLLVCCICEAHS
jgi:hypothetical protein